MHPNRLIRVNELLGQQISEFLLPKLSEKWGIVSLVEVVLSPDLSQAKIYLSFLEHKLTNQQVRKIIQPYIPELVSKIRKLDLKKIPHLLFFASAAYEKSQKIDDLFEKL